MHRPHQQALQESLIDMLAWPRCECDDATVAPGKMPMTSASGDVGLRRSWSGTKLHSIELDPEYHQQRGVAGMKILKPSPAFDRLSSFLSSLTVRL